MKHGVYETIYGNAAEVDDENDITAYDLDMAQTIPIQLVTSKFIRALTLMLLFCSVSFAAEIPREKAVYCVIGEAEGEGEGEGYNGMLAVAQAMRRRGTTRGVYGCRAPRVIHHQYSTKTFVRAVRAWEDSRTAVDITRGSNSWYSESDVKKDPGIYDRCEFKIKIGSQYFFDCYLGRIK